MRTFRLVIACPDGVGIVAKVSNFLASTQWLDLKRATTRMIKAAGSLCVTKFVPTPHCHLDLTLFARRLPHSPKSFRWVAPLPIPLKRVVLMASREDPPHLADLLHRWHSDELNCNLVRDFQPQ